jgi:DNA recombination protein RmuC
VTLGLAALALAGVALAVALVLLARFSRLANGLSAGVEPALLRLDQVLRDELARGRGEAAENARMLRQEVTGALEGVRGVIEGRLEAIRTDNNQQLEKMRTTVDEKLQATLQERLGASFKLVSEQLEQVFRSVGEVQALQAGVADLKRVLTNVKTRGTWGEVSLGGILGEILTPEQYAKNVEIRPGSGERVEFAIRLPGGDGERPLWLPIDAKFPTEDYERLAEAAERADAVAIDAAAKAIEQRIRKSAREISTKYVAPPHSTDFALLFLPTEGLYAEVLRRAGLVDGLQREWRIVVAGPSTLLALLNSLRMGFRTLAIQERTSEVWQVLGAVKTEFGRYGGVLDQVQKKLQDASKTLDTIGTRRRAIESRLRGLETLPEQEAGRLLGFDDGEEAPPLPEAAED